MNISKMTGLWQRVMNINKNDQVAVNKKDEGEEQKTKSERSRFPKGNWIRKLGNYSPTNWQVPSSSPRTSRTRVAGGSGLCNTYEAVTLGRTSTSPETSLAMPGLENIIRDFEMGYLSPSKENLAMDQFKQKNFVKKIVEAFEVKFKTAQEMKEFQDGQKVVHQPKRSPGFFASPSTSSPEASKRPEKADASVDSKRSWEDVRDANRKTGNFSTPPKYNSDYWNNSKRSGAVDRSVAIGSYEERNRSDYSTDAENEDGGSAIFSTPSKNTSEDSKSSKMSGIFSSSFDRSGSKDSNSSESDIYKSPVNLDSRNTENFDSDNSDVFKFDKEDSDEKLNFYFSPVKMSSLDETKTLESIDLDGTLPQPEETIFLSGTGLPKTSTMIGEFPEEELPRVSTIERTPKIVGAFLKKPIEVEDTSIDWIPITGKKLPRKRSLKKLFSLLTGKKSLEKRNKMFSSQRNLYEDSREFQDSGYDEKSCSSSSLTSLISFTEAMLTLENVGPEKRSNFNTFRSGKTENGQDDEAFYETCAVARKSNDRKLMLTEMPREEVKLDLGPAFPPPKIVTMSLDRKTLAKKTRSPPPVYDTLAKVPKHPNYSKIPKHPFISLTKIDRLENLDEELPLIVKNDPRDVVFHRAGGNVHSATLSRNSSSAQNDYDVPRKFHSKSEPEILQIYWPTGTKGEEPIYDVPRIHSIHRPRSSVYENAVSLRRRSANLVQHISSLYPRPCVAAFHYDTVKPRNCNVVFDRNGIRSDSDLIYLRRPSVF